MQSWRFYFLKAHLLRSFCLSGIFAASTLIAQTVNVQSGWDLFGASEDISSMTPFDAACVKSVYAYQNGSWRIYPTSDDTQKITSIAKGRGFWVNGNSACTITAGSGGGGSTTPTQTALSIQTLYLPDRIVEGTEVPAGVIAYGVGSAQWSAAKGSFKDTSKLSTTYIAPLVRQDENESVTLTISDGMQTVSKTVYTTISKRVNSAPIIKSVSIPQSVAQGSTVTIDALVIDDYDSATATKYFWTSSIGKIAQQTSKATTFTAPTDANGSVIFRLTACDGENACSEINQTVQITCSGSGCPAPAPVVTANTPPTIKSVSIPQTISVGSTVSLDALVYDDRDSVDALRFFWVPSIGSISNQELKATTYTAPTDINGSVKFRLTVCDTSNACSETNQTIPFVCVGSTCPSNPVSTPPAIKGISYPTAADQNQSVQIVSFVVDSSGLTPLTYFWTTSLGQIDNNNTSSTIFHTPSSSGTAQLKLITCNQKAFCSEQNFSIAIR